VNFIIQCFGADPITFMEKPGWFNAIFINSNIWQHMGKDGKAEYTSAIINDPRGMVTAISQFAPWPSTGITHGINDKNASAVNPPQVQEAAKKLEPYIPPILAAPIFDATTSKKVDTLSRGINTFIDESKAKFINGELTFSKWDEYVATLDKMGLNHHIGLNMG